MKIAGVRLETLKVERISGARVKMEPKFPRTLNGHELQTPDLPLFIAEKPVKDPLHPELHDLGVFGEVEPSLLPRVHLCLGPPTGWSSPHNRPLAIATAGSPFFFRQKVALALELLLSLTDRVSHREGHQIFLVHLALGLPRIRCKLHHAGRVC